MKYKIINLQLLILILFIYSQWFHFHILKNKFINEIEQKYKSSNQVNINQVYNIIYNVEEIFNPDINSTINIGFTLDKNYIYETMLTISSIMATQRKNTKIRFHLGVTKNFLAVKMAEIFELKKKLNNNTEFNFYYLKESVIKMKGFHHKGEACPGKFELPIYLPDDVEKLIIFDGGDLLVLRDLTKLIIPDSKKNYIPFKFGGICLFSNDEYSDSLMFNQLLGYKNWINSSLSSTLPDNPKSEIGILLQLNNPRFIHQFYGKWEKGDGLSIYRHLAKYFMLISGISTMLCKKKPKYCL